MKLKPVTLALISVFSATAIGSAYAADNNDIQQKLSQIMAKQQQLQKQVAVLKTELRDQQLAKSQKLLMNKNTEQAVHAYSFVRLGSYLGQQYQFDGSELIVNSPSILQDLALIKQRQQQSVLSKKNGYPQESNPYLVLSGEVEGQANYAKANGGNYSSNLDLSDLKVAMQAVVSPWVTGFINLEYNNGTTRHSTRFPISASSNDAVLNSSLGVRDAFITIGNLTKAPAYGSIGQLFVPFGRYSSAMAVSPITEAFRTKARALSLGYYQSGDNGFSSNLFAFSAANGTVNQKNRFANYGLDLSYHFTINSMTSEIGAGYISNIASAQGLSDNGNPTPCGPNSFNQGHCEFAGFSWLNKPLANTVGGYDIHAKASFGKFTAIAEYVTAAKKFNVNDLFFMSNHTANKVLPANDIHGAKPKAFDVQGVYNFMAGNLPTAFALEYAQSSQALAMNIPKQAYAAGLNFDVWKDTIFSLEYAHNKDYAKGDISGSVISNNNQGHVAQASVLGDGKSSNVITAQIDMYF